jgi:Zn-dependent protease with chaperone function
MTRARDVAPAGPRDHRAQTSLALAVAVNVSFYVLLIGIVLAAVGAIAVVVAVWGRVGLYACTVPIGVTVAGVRRMLIACWPRRGETPVAGVLASRITEPGLWAVIDEVSGQAGQPRVDELRLTLVGGASCRLHREGRRRTHRVLTLSLAYLQVLGEPELRAVIAHELSHFAGGDLAFGRRIAVVCDALRRTHARLDRLGSVMRYPLRWYGRALFGLLASLSREREFSGDAYAARLSDPVTMARALRITAWVETAFAIYWQRELAPVLAGGLRPAVAGGFGLFTSFPAVQAHLSYWSDVADHGSFDTHPVLVERLAALRRDASSAPEFLHPTVTLLSDVEAVEVALLRETSGDASQLQPISWPAAAQHIYPPGWAAFAQNEPELIADLIASDIPARLDARDDDPADRDPAGDLAVVRVLACALASALVRAGWQVHSLPGAPVVLRRGDTSIRPFDELSAIWFSGLLRSEWAARCEHAGIAELSLAVHAPADPASKGVAIPARLAVTPNAAPIAPVVELGHARPWPVELTLDRAERSGGLSRGAMWFTRIVDASLVAILLAEALTYPSLATTVAVALLIGLGLAWMLYAQRPTQRSTPRVALGPDGVTITHRGLLRAPLHIPRDALRTIAVDTTTENNGRRFPVYDTSEWTDPAAPAGQPCFWFWADNRAARSTPYYGLHRQTPNVLVLLDVALTGPRVRRQRIHGPLNGETLSALLLKVADPEQTHEALARLGFSPRLLLNDFRPARPPDHDAAPTTEATAA